MTGNRGFGIDIGGSGVKGGVVDLDVGQLVGERLRVPTPKPSTPDAVAEVVAGIVREFGWTGPLGVTLPSVIQRGIVRTAANIDKGWLDTDATNLFAKNLDRTAEQIVVLNDADAAGVAEVRYGWPGDQRGVVVLLTFGTGIGSALFIDGVLVPNTEFGHLEVDGHDAETRAAASVKEDQELSWEQWAKRVSRYISVLENLVWPDLIIAGGGVSKKADKWIPLLNVRTRVVAAELRNDAGIVGAAAASAVLVPPRPSIGS